MEKKAANKSKNKVFKAVQAAISFQNLPFRPRRDTRADVIASRLKLHQSKVLSGPIVSMIPAEARRISKNFENQEPTSPKVSCMGQIKHKKASLPKELKPVSVSKPDKTNKIGPTSPNPDMTTKTKKHSGTKKIFGAGRKSDALIDRAKAPTRGAAPSLSQIRKFASSRNTFVNFDWTAAQIAPAVDREYYSDGERAYSDGEEVVIVPFSAPMLVSGAGCRRLGFGAEEGYKFEESDGSA
ncbi:hypothetical protein OROMI_031970 [Orobanche minor]